MPRISKPRGKASTYRGISHHKVCILSAADDHDQCIFLIQGLGEETSEKADSLIPYIQKDEEQKNNLITDMKQIYEHVCTSTNRKHIEVKAGCHVTDEGYSLSNINQLHSEFTIISKIYRGISVRHLQGYLDFFAYCKSLGYRIEKTKAKTVHAYKSLTKEMSYIHVRDICKLDMPIDLFQAYGDWHYGCFAN